eukprot:TRINITY_DN2930_c0_g1_i1.p1 TRINITY_DN2930_c0_g1~~TRINITY_DN2930_c0_g1_i1.p1  ORF type:complete len:596 (+),score=134.42 TRINITY_DN2930_c0_g1_i1:37-1788(+)
MRVALSLCLVSILIICCLDIASGAVCPGTPACSGHGTCDTRTGICKCISGWGGDDCSASLLSLTSGQLVTQQNVNKGGWKYYTIPTNYSSGLTVTVTTLNAGGDPDVYILQNSFPTFGRYYAADTSGSSPATIIVPNGGSNVWYIGVYGYLTSTFSIIANVSGQCADVSNCNGNGVCVAPNQCSCYSGWSGADCGTPISTLSFGSSYSANVASGAWRYYQFYVQNSTLSQTLTINCQQWNSDGDIDFYLQVGSLPTRYAYYTSDSGTLSNFTMVISNIPGGIWYLGTYGYRNTSFTFNVRLTSIDTSCANKCSGHGTCSNAVCSCNSFSHSYGSYCEYLDHTLYVGSYPITGYIERGYWNYFTVDLDSINNWIITMNDTADLDIYYSLTNYPTANNFTGYNTGTSRTSVITLSGLGDSPVYFGIYGYAAVGNYSVGVSLDSNCPNSCSSRGSCSNGVCYCSTGYAGPDCSQYAPVLNNGVSVTGQINNATTFNYFTFDVTTSSFLTINLQETNSLGFLWLYVSFGYSPSVTNYYTRDTSTGANHKIQFQPPVSNTTYQIGVYSNNYANNFPLTYSLAAWASPF